MTQTRDLLKKMADFFTGEEFSKKGEDARLEFSPDDIRCMYDIIKQKNNVSVANVGDLISRQTAFIALNKRAENVSLKTRICLLDAVRVIDELPSVEPEQNLQPTCNQLATDCVSRQAVLDLFAEKCDVVRPYHEVWQAVKELPSVESEKCGDCVSRKDVIKAVYDWLEFYDPFEPDEPDLDDVLGNLPPVEPERKTGKWINVDGTTNSADCSCCGNRGRAWMNYCYMCGSPMEVSTMMD